MTTNEAQTLNEVVKAKLDAYARRAQYEGAIRGDWGYLSTPRGNGAEGKGEVLGDPRRSSVNELLRHSGAEPGDKITKAHEPACEAIARLDG